MTFWHAFWIITGIHLLAAASPGPDFVLVSQQALSRGRGASLQISLGIALGFAVHVTYSVLGLAVLVVKSMWLLTALKFLGGAYLIYLGIKGVCAKPRTSAALQTKHEQAAPFWQNVRRGFFCNVLNPKPAMFMVSLFAVVLPPSTPLSALTIYGVWMVITLFAWFALVSCVLSMPAINQKFQCAGHWIDRICGGALIALGIKMMVSH